MKYQALTPEHQQQLLTEKLHFFEREHYIQTLELTMAESLLEQGKPGAANRVLEVKQKLDSIEHSIQALGKLNGI